MVQAFARFSILIATLLLSHYGAAAVNDAKSFVVKVTRELETALMEGRDRGLLEDEQYLDGLIDKHILPYIDRETLCKQVFRPRWDEIVAEQKTGQAYQAVIASLKRTYRLALAAYNGQQIDIGDGVDKGRYSLVRTRVQTREDSHTIDLALRRIDDDWRIFDFAVDGVVVTRTLNTSIQRILEEQDIDAVIRAIDPQGAPAQD